MSKQSRDMTQAIMDGVLKFIAGGGFLTLAIVVPNSAQVFDKPLNKLLTKLDQRARQREVHRVLYYMKKRGLIAYTAYDYQSGMVLTKIGKKQLRRRNFETLTIPSPDKWDRKWRLVFFDIPEELKVRRNAFSAKLRSLGLQQLQKSIWIHPFNCRREVEAVTEMLHIRRFVTYVEVTQIDGADQLIKKFKSILF